MADPEPMPRIAPVEPPYAQETAALTKAQILQQASTAMVSKTLQIPQNVLTLIQHI